MTVKYASLRDFSRIMGVTLKAVQKAISSGRIETTIYDGVKVIEVEKSIADWKKNTNPTQSFASRLQKKNPPPSPLAETKKGAVPEFAESRAIREAFQARMVKLEYDKKRGRVVEKKEIEKEAFEFGKLIRDSIKNIPARVSAELAAVTKAEPFLIEKVLNEQFDEILNLLSSGYFAVNSETSPEDAGGYDWLE